MSADRGHLDFPWLHMANGRFPVLELSSCWT